MRKKDNLYYLKAQWDISSRFVTPYTIKWRYLYPRKPMSIRDITVRNEYVLIRYTREDDFLIHENGEQTHRWDWDEGTFIFDTSSCENKILEAMSLVPSGGSFQLIGNSLEVTSRWGEKTKYYYHNSEFVRLT